MGGKDSFSQRRHNQSFKQEMIGDPKQDSTGKTGESAGKIPGKWIHGLHGLKGFPE
jgi:hypothetical protein